MRSLGVMGLVLTGLVACGSDVTNPGGGGQGGTTSSSQGGNGQGGSAQGGGGQGGGGQGGSGQAGGSTGGAGPCLAATNDYGDCDMALGWAFDGADCVSFSGCGCEPDCAAFSQDFATCVAGCQGFCDEAAFLGAGIAADGWGEGDFCDAVYTCVKADVAPLLEEVITAVDCSGTSGCAAGTVRCTLAFAGVVSADQAAELCAATLIEDVDALYCEVLGG